VYQLIQNVFSHRTGNPSRDGPERILLVETEKGYVKNRLNACPCECDGMFDIYNHNVVVNMDVIGGGGGGQQKRALMGATSKRRFGL
jgi:hypothetical protein